jgi:hypothetical protein
MLTSGEGKSKLIIGGCNILQLGAGSASEAAFTSRDCCGGRVPESFCGSELSARRVHRLDVGPVEEFLRAWIFLKFVQGIHDLLVLGRGSACISAKALRFSQQEMDSGTLIARS